MQDSDGRCYLEMISGNKLWEMRKLDRMSVSWELECQLVSEEVSYNVC